MAVKVDNPFMVFLRDRMLSDAAGDPHEDKQGASGWRYVSPARCCSADNTPLP
jgi:hypothetical protein